MRYKKLFLFCPLIGFGHKTDSFEKNYCIPAFRKHVLFGLQKKRFFANRNKN
jgi:hypothetical protein